MKTIKFEKDDISVLIDLVELMMPGNIKAEKVKNRLLRKLKRALRPIKTSSSKGKGRALQQRVCKDIAEMLNIDYNQQDDNCLIHSREMGQRGVDIILRGEAIKKFPFSIECKSTEHFSLNKTIAQSKKNLAENTDWMIVHRNKSISNPVVILDWNVFLKIIK